MTTYEPTGWTYAYISLSVALTLVWVTLYVLRHDLNAGDSPCVASPAGKASNVLCAPNDGQPER